VKTKTINPAATIPGIDKGAIICQRIRISVQPSILAASSISCGMVRKYVVIIQGK